MNKLFWYACAVLLTLSAGESNFAKGEPRPFPCQNYRFRDQCNGLVAGTPRETYADEYAAIMRARSQDKSLPGPSRDSLPSPSEVQERCRSQCYWLEGNLSVICVAHERGLTGSTSAGSSSSYSTSEVNIMRGAQRAVLELNENYFRDPEIFRRALRPCRYQNRHFLPITRAYLIADQLGYLNRRLGASAITPEQTAHSVRLLRTLFERCNRSAWNETWQSLGGLGQNNPLFAIQGITGAAGDNTGFTNTVEERVRRARVFDRAAQMAGLRAGTIQTCPQLVCVLSRSLHRDHVDVRALETELNCAQYSTTGAPNGKANPDVFVSEPPPEKGVHF